MSHEEKMEDLLFEELFKIACVLHHDVLKLNFDYGSGELTRLHFSTLDALSVHQPIAITDLASIMQIAKQQMTGMLDKLESLNFIVRLPDPNDRRCLRISMTEVGSKALRTAKAGMGHAMKQRLSTLDDANKTELLHSLQSLSAIIAKLPK
jgi:DNA-binding MarR family transcriptional regulator